MDIEKKLPEEIVSGLAVKAVLNEKSPSSKQIQSSGSGSQLPEEIVEEILSRLPVKAVLRFRCVSKSWQSTLCSERFIKKHLKYSTRNTFVIVASKPARTWIHSEATTKMWRCSLASLFSKPDIHDLEFKFPPMRSSYLTADLAGCCNGLVCLLLNEKEFILWNPSTRISRRLPPVVADFDAYASSYGFGYDESSGDYKVMSLTNRQPPHVCRVYSLKSDSWKKKKGWNEYAWNLPCSGEGKFVGGKLHWKAWRANMSCIQDVKNIVSFDMSREVRGVVELPQLGSERAAGKLGKIGECLSLLCYYPARIDVWVMKEESWQKQVTVEDAVYDVCKASMTHFFCLGSEEETILLENGSFLIYYPDGCYKRVGNLNLNYYQADIYHQSLVQL